MSLAARISSKYASTSYLALAIPPNPYFKPHGYVSIQSRTVSAITRRRQAKAERSRLHNSQSPESISNGQAWPAADLSGLLNTPLSTGTGGPRPFIHPHCRGPPIPHEVFCTRLRTAKSESDIRSIIAKQLRHCHHATDVLRVVAVAQQRPTGLKHLATLEEPLSSAMYQIRATGPDLVVLQTLTAIIARLRCANLHVSQTLLGLGLKFAARSRSLNGMKRFLSLFRSAGFTMNNDLFRAIVAKCSIGANGYGEIRNGRWQQSDLLQVLHGFDDCTHLPPEKQFHLATFMDRRSWHMILGWVALLAHCKQSEAVWREWESWRQPAAEYTPSRLLPSEHPSLQPHPISGATAPNRDVWFLRQLLKTGDGRLSWKLLRQANLNFVTLPTDLKAGLLDHIQYCPADLWIQALVDEPGKVHT